MYVQGEMYRWKLPEEISNIDTLAVDLNVSTSIASVLWNRGYKTKNDVHRFLFYSYDEKTHHSRNLLDAEKAVDRIIKAINSNEKILIAGDYDVDGMTSTSLMFTALKHCNASVNFFLPHRTNDGYGLSEKIIEKAHKNLYTLIITVDNGTSAYAALEKAAEYGIDVIVTDHHQPHDNTPLHAYALVNPHQSGCTYPFKELAGVGVAFKVVQLLYEKLSLVMPDRISELLLLGTIADVVPLIGENRHWVSNGLLSLRNKQSTPLSILKENARIAPARILSSLDIGFSIAPQLNALGRLDDPRQAVHFLLSNDQEEASIIGAQLYEFNQTRKHIEQAVVEEIKRDIKARDLQPRLEGCIVAMSDQWPAGVVGLAAARISNYYGVPTCILHETPDGLLKGSCRSIPECNIFECLQQIPSSLLISFGGHAFAAGLSLEKKNVEEFKEAFSKAIFAQCTQEDLCPKINLDASLDLEEINESLWNSLQLLEPFGSHNAFPLFHIPDVYIAAHPQLIKDQHVKIKIISGKSSNTVIFFNRPELFSLISEHQLKSCSLAGKISENSWNNKKSIEIIGTDIIFN